MKCTLNNSTYIFLLLSIFPVIKVKYYITFEILIVMITPK
jgi:hypothetical protein